MNEENVAVYILKNESIRLKVTNIGATIVELEVKDKNNQWQDIVLGLNNIEDYLTKNEPSFGSTVGRYANRIKEAQLTIDDKCYQLDQNDGENCLHSGFNRYSNRLWQLEKYTDTEVSLKLISPDGDQGFPGNMTIVATYQLVGNSIKITYSGISDKKTVFNPTNHTYFNLNGHKNGSILNHQLKIASHYFMPLDEKSIPIGNKEDVTGTPMDFLTKKTIKDQFNKEDKQLCLANGYDHYFILDKPHETIEIYSPITGISLSITTNLPGFQLYTANFLDNTRGKDNSIYNQREAFCVETQFCPNSINQDGLNDMGLIEKNELVKRETIWTFTN